MKKLTFKTADFAEQIGTTPKTVYKLIERKELLTDNEVINGRNIRVIVTNEEEIKEFQKRYGKITVNNGECEEILTVNDSEEQLKKSNDTFSKSTNSEELTALSKAIDVLRYVIDSNQNQTKLLTDSEHNLKENYFELNANYQTLQIKFDSLKEENEKLKEEINTLKTPWYKKIGQSKHD
jgi:chromosome segregation ATPase